MRRKMEGAMRVSNFASLLFAQNLLHTLNLHNRDFTMNRDQWIPVDQSALVAQITHTNDVRMIGRNGVPV